MKIQFLVVVKIQLLVVVLALAGCGGPAAKGEGPAAKASSTSGDNAFPSGWEYTRWGMTPQEVVSASKNLAIPGTDLAPDGDGNVSKLVAPFQSGKFSFRVDFGFNSADRLASVTLVLDDKSVQMIMDNPNMNMSNMTTSNMVMSMMSPGVCSDLQASIFAAYGVADHGGSTHIYGEWYWRDPKTRNNVNYTVLYEVGCFVQYSAIK